MNIGIFTDTYYPQINGVATSALMLKENLEALGHKVYVFTTTDPLADINEKNVFRVASLPFRSARRVGALYNPRLARKIRRLNLDIIHTNTEFPLGIFGRTMARELKIPLLHTYHTIYEDYTHYIVKFGALDSIAKSAARRLSKRFCNSADEVIVPTEKVRDLLLSYEVSKEITVIPTGINLDKFYKDNYHPDKIMSIKSDLGIKSTDKVMLYIGRISEEKNIEEILLSLKEYLKNKSDVKFLLIGDGPEKDNLEELSKDLGIDEKTIFAGERPWDEIGMYYQLGDLFISASQSETQGLTYIEALASGLPVVAKYDRCLDEVVENNENGYTYTEVNQLPDYLDSILFNDENKNRLSIAAMESVEKFSVGIFAKSIENHYKKMLNRYRRKLRAS